MSLATDSIFIAALQSSPELLHVLGYVAPSRNSDGHKARLYGTAIPLPDEDVDNVPVPYCIVTFDDLNNQVGTKDDLYESSYDNVNIGIEVAGETLTALHMLTQLVRDTVLTYFREHDTAIDDYTFTAGPIQFDGMKPCYWQVLRYQCDVNNL